MIIPIQALVYNESTDLDHAIKCPRIGGMSMGVDFLAKKNKRIWPAGFIKTDSQEQISPVSNMSYLPSKSLKNM